MARTWARNRAADRRRHRLLRRWFWGTCAVAPLGLVVAYLGWSYGWSVPSVGEAAPAFTLPDAAGRPVDVGLYLGQRPVVLLFYMTYG